MHTRRKVRHPASACPVRGACSGTCRRKSREPTTRTCGGSTRQHHVVELHAAPCRPQVGYDQASLLRQSSFTLRVACAFPARSGPEEIFDQLGRRTRPDVLSEVAPAGLQYPVDLRPVRLYRMARRHQLERPVHERERSALRRFHDLDTPRPKQLTGSLHVRRPRLSRDHPPRERDRLRENFPAPGVYVEGRPSLTKTAAQETRISPRGSFLNGTAAQPVECPARYISRGRLCNQVFERPYEEIMPFPRSELAVTPRAENRDTRPGELRPEEAVGHVVPEVPGGRFGMGRDRLGVGELVCRLAL